MTEKKSPADILLKISKSLQFPPYIAFEASAELCLAAFLQPWFPLRLCFQHRHSSIPASFPRCHEEVAVVMTPSRSVSLLRVQQQMQQRPLRSQSKRVRNKPIIHGRMASDLKCTPTGAALQGNQKLLAAVD